MSTAFAPARQPEPNAEAAALPRPADDEQTPAPPSPSLLHDGPRAHRALARDAPARDAFAPAALAHDAFAPEGPFARAPEPATAAFASSPPPARRGGSGQPMAVPGRANGHGSGHGSGARLRELGFAGPRSPPSNKSTSHVPCKFYRQGACQAGKACPFLHSDEPVGERAPCKYFTKGNCKFGHKCALAHILPNGHVVNAHLGRGHFGRVHIHSPDPPLNSSLLTLQAHMAPAPPAYAFALPDDAYAAHSAHSAHAAHAAPPARYDAIPTIDAAFAAPPPAAYGSPPPVPTGLSVMDVPLPASFDSQGISHMARYGPIASSVPATFLAASPPSSYHADSPALRTLHDSAFGHPARPRAALGSSPPDPADPPAARRMLHSELAAARSRTLLSSSVGARPAYKDDEWDDADMVGKFEEDLLPHSLSDLLTPQEKLRRFSRDHADADPHAFSHHAAVSRFGASPTASDTRYGSPSVATGSPSRFQSLWGKSKPLADTFESASLPGASAFGHVGSPLRTASFHPTASPAPRTAPRAPSGDTSPFVASPPRNPSMSILSQHLQRTRLSPRDDAPATSPAPVPQHPGINRLTSASAGRLNALDRTASSSSISRERIDEEQGLFSMEDEDEAKKSTDGASETSSSSLKRLSGVSWGSGGKGSPGVKGGLGGGGGGLGGLGGFGREGVWGK